MSDQVKSGKKHYGRKVFYVLFIFSVVLLGSAELYFHEGGFGGLFGGNGNFSIPLHSKSAVLIELDSGKVCMEKNSSQKIYPASMTKIMTAMIAIENLPDLEEKITLESPMFTRLYEQSASLAGFLPNERVRAIDLLYGALLPSGAECCIGLAEAVAGSEEEFVKMMNEKAVELKMDHTRFLNTTGLHQAEHYSTVMDMAVLLRDALQNETFRRIFTEKEYTAAPTDLHPNGIVFDSTLFQELKDTGFEGGRILGGKTGYTREAGLCLASLGEKGGKEYILVTAKADGNHGTEAFHVTDAWDVFASLN